VPYNSVGSPLGSVAVAQNTSWGNLRDTHQNRTDVGELFLYSAYNVQASQNLIQTSSATGLGGNAIYAMAVGNGNTTDQVYNNFASGVSGNNTVIYSSGSFAYGPGNTIGTTVTFTSPTVPGAPSCSSFSSTVLCMGSLIADFVPTTAGASSYGYQQPSSTPVYDPLFPTWLCPYTSQLAGLVTSGCASPPPVNYLLTVTASNGSVSGTNCGTQSYVSGTFIGPCTPVANPGYSFSGWSNISGSAVCTGTVVPCAQFALGQNSGFTANFVAIPIGSPIGLSGQLIAKGQVQMH
jgi:hypothetical protein